MSDFERALQNSLKKNLPWAAVSTLFVAFLGTVPFHLYKSDGSLQSSVADPDPGAEIRDWVAF